MTTEQHEAFAAVLRELYRLYPLPEYKYRKTRWRREYDREVAVRNARKGSPLHMIEVFIDCHVPNKEVMTLHAMIYG